jgi:phenylalanyl-tRNA synthetase beta chain
MPTIDVDYAEFERMLGLKLQGDLEKTDELLAFVKGEVKLFDEKEGLMSVEIKDTNRPDLWNIEGLVRALRGFLGLENGLRKYVASRSSVEVNVDGRLSNIRPYIGCSVVKRVKLTDAIIRGLMHLQDKLDQTYGRHRQRTSIGLYDFSLIKPPLSYTVAKPAEVSFAPLGFEEKMSLKEILQRHPKGLEYGHIVRGHSVYPMLLDAEKKVLSFPPIINSNDLGKITEKTRNVLIEVTGTVHETVLNTLKIVTLSLIDRGGIAYSATVNYPREKKAVVTPSFETGTMKLDVEYVNKVLGLKLGAKEIGKLLEKAGFGVTGANSCKIIVSVPCYRIDVMHPVDIVEDVAIAYGYNNIEPLWRKLPTTGGERAEQRLLDVARELMVGLGFQEVLTFNLTSTDSLFAKMNCKKQRVVELANPKVQTLTCLRSWLLPSLMEFVSNNLHVECPQKIFEQGKITLLDEKKETRTRDEERLAAVMYHANASFTEIKSTLDAFFMNLGLEWEIKETKHPSFIEGRAGAAIVGGENVGVLGELNPKVLEAWKLENPVAAFELNMEKVAKIKKAK